MELPASSSIARSPLASQKRSCDLSSKNGPLRHCATMQRASVSKSFKHDFGSSWPKWERPYPSTFLFRLLALLRHTLVSLGLAGCPMEYLPEVRRTQTVGAQLQGDLRYTL